MPSPHAGVILWIPTCWDNCRSFDSHGLSKYDHGSEAVHVCCLSLWMSEASFDLIRKILPPQPRLRQFPRQT